MVRQSTIDKLHDMRLSAMADVRRHFNWCIDAAIATNYNLYQFCSPLIVCREKQHAFFLAFFQHHSMIVLLHVKREASPAKVKLPPSITLVSARAILPYL